MQIASPSHVHLPTVSGICLSACWGSLEDALRRVQRIPRWHQRAGFKATLSSVSELELQKPPYSAYGTAAGANPAAEQQTTRKVGASSYSCSLGGFSFRLNSARRMIAQRRQEDH